MTLLVADIASYQQGLTLTQLRAAGIGAINVKTSHGLTTKSVHPEAARWVADARTSEMGVCTFHWLDGSALGADQAVYAHQQMLAWGGPAGMAHVVDVEADATEAHYRDYVTTMTRLLGRPICTYTGDHWWQPRGWAGRTPWLWAAPNDGYLPAYPGDDSPHWQAGYGSWPDLAVMQYAVLPVAGIRVSMSAVRDAAVWAAMTGGPMPSWVVVPALEALRHEFNDVFPDRDKTSDGGIGDTSHGARPSGHNPDESGSPEDRDADHIDEVRARDFDADLRHPTVRMEDVCQHLLQACRTGRITWIKYLIFNRRIWSAADGWVQRDYTGVNPHDKHLHVSCKSDTVSENDTRPVGLASLVEDDVSAQDVITALQSAAGQAALTSWANSAAGRRALGVAVGTADVVPRTDPTTGSTVPADGPDPYVTVAQVLSFLHRDARLLKLDTGALKTGITQTAQRLATVQTMVGATGDQLGSFDARERDEVPLTVQQMQQLLAEAIPDSVGPLTPDEARAAVLGALRTAFSGEQS